MKQKRTLFQCKFCEKQAKPDRDNPLIKSHNICKSCTLLKEKREQSSYKLTTGKHTSVRCSKQGCDRWSRLEVLKKKTYNSKKPLDKMLCTKCIKDLPPQHQHEVPVDRGHHRMKNSMASEQKKRKNNPQGQQSRLECKNADCDAIFQTKKGLSDHVKEVHNNTKPEYKLDWPASNNKIPVAIPQSQSEPKNSSKKLQDQQLKAKGGSVSRARAPLIATSMDVQPRASDQAPNDDDQILSDDGYQCSEKFQNQSPSSESTPPHSNQSHFKINVFLESTPKLTETQPRIKRSKIIKQPSLRSNICQNSVKKLKKDIQLYQNQESNDSSEGRRSVRFQKHRTKSNPYGTPSLIGTLSPLRLDFSSSSSSRQHHHRNRPPDKCQHSLPTTDELKELFVQNPSKRYKKRDVKKQGLANKVLFDGDEKLDKEFWSVLMEMKSDLSFNGGPPTEKLQQLLNFKPTKRTKKMILESQKVAMKMYEKVCHYVNHLKHQETIKNKNDQYKTQDWLTKRKKYGEPGVPVPINSVSAETKDRDIFHSKSRHKRQKFIDRHRDIQKKFHLLKQDFEYLYKNKDAAMQQFQIKKASNMDAQEKRQNYIVSETESQLELGNHQISLELKEHNTRIRSPCHCQSKVAKETSQSEISKSNIYNEPQLSYHDLMQSIIAFNDMQFKIEEQFDIEMEKFKNQVIASQYFTIGALSGISNVDHTHLQKIEPLEKALEQSKQDGKPIKNIIWKFNNAAYHHESQQQEKGEIVEQFFEKVGKKLEKRPNTRSTAKIRKQNDQLMVFREFVIPIEQFSDSEIQYYNNNRFNATLRLQQPIDIDNNDLLNQLKNNDIMYEKVGHLISHVKKLSHLKNQPLQKFNKRLQSMRYDASVAIIKRHLTCHVESPYRILSIQVKYPHPNKGKAARKVGIDMKSDLSQSDSKHQNIVKDNKKLDKYLQMLQNLEESTDKIPFDDHQVMLLNVLSDLSKDHFDLIEIISLVHSNQIQVELPIDIGNVDYSKMQKQQKEMNRRIIGRILLTDYKFKGGQKEYLFRIEDKNSRDVVDKYLKIEKKEINLQHKISMEQLFNDDDRNMNDQEMPPKSKRENEDQNMEAVIDAYNSAISEKGCSDKVLHAHAKM